MTRRSFSALVCMAAPAAAESRQERGKRVIDEALGALGGPRYLAIRDRLETGRAYSFYREQLSGRSLARIYTRYLTRPDPAPPDFFGQRERQSFGKDEDTAVLFADGNAYEITFRGARPLPADRRERYYDTARRNIFYILRMRIGERGLLFESQGADILDHQPVEIVDITDSENRVVTVYFHQSTKLPLRQVFYRRDPQTKDRMEEVTVFSKYRDVGGGVQWPLVIQRDRNGEKIYEIFSDTVVINQDLKDTLFALPANMKVLKEEK